MFIVYFIATILLSFQHKGKGGIEDISPKDIILHLSETRAPIYAALIGYGSVDESTDNMECEITASIEKAVLWRSNPEYS
ncbi:MAG: hypothetical protein LUH82_07410 [Clostridiales bacterium]|nr:hypothetical protein [Clostridiales bacterium]